MRRLVPLGVVSSVIVIGCAAPPTMKAPFTSEELSETRTKSLDQVSIAKSNGYLERMATLWMRDQLPTKGNCTRAAGGAVDLYLTIESDGTVSNVIGDPWNPRSACYKEAYSGIRVLEPPVSPFYFKLQLY